MQRKRWYAERLQRQQMNKPLDQPLDQPLDKPSEIRAVTSLRMSVNGKSVEVSNPSRRLSDTLRDELGLTGTKIGCNAGDCGACTVLLDGEQVCACLTATGQCAGREVTTVEGLAQSGKLDALALNKQRS